MGGELLELLVELAHFLLDLGELLGRHSQALLRFVHLLSLGVDLLRHGVVVDHGVNPLEESRTGGGDLHDLIRVELLVLHVREDAPDLSVGDSILVELDQAIEEPRVGHHGLCALPGDILDASENDNALANLLDENVGVGKIPHFGDVLLLEIVQSGRGLLQGWDGLLESLLGLLLLDRNLLARDLEFLLLGLGNLLLGLDFLRADADHAEELVTLLCGLVHHLLRLCSVNLHGIHLRGRLNQLLQAAVQSIGELADALAVVAQKLPVGRDEVQVVLRGHVVVPSQLLGKEGALFPHALVHKDHVLHNLLLLLLRDVLRRQKDAGDAAKGLGGPGLEPIDHGVVDHTGKVPAPGSERVSHGGHGENDVQVFLALFREVGPAALLRVQETQSRDLVPDASDDGLLLVISVQRRHRAGRQHVVDQLQKSLIDNVRVGEEEDAGLCLQNSIELLEILPEHVLIVAPGQSDGEGIAPGGVGGQGGEALLS